MWNARFEERLRALERCWIRGECWFMELCDEMNSSAHDFGTMGFLDYFTIFYDFI